MQTTEHQPVLLAEVLDYLRPTAGDSYLDLTAGYGGHAGAILEQTGKPEAAFLVDRDQQAITALEGLFGAGPQIIRSDFLAASQKLVAEDKQFDLILADLGVSSVHLNQADRGFSFSQDGPLDMRMDNRQELSAEVIVNSWTTEQISDILQRYGQEPKAGSIANKIVANRPISTTSELAAIVKQAWPGHSRVHPATRTFQAIRMAVNDELGQLEQALPIWIKLLKPGGRLGVISFHSGEDAIVKQFFAEHAGNHYDSELKLLTKKPVTPLQNELATNPRSRSAKLRAVAKIKT